MESAEGVGGEGAHAEREAGGEVREEPTREEVRVSAMSPREDGVGERVGAEELEALEALEVLRERARREGTRGAVLRYLAARVRGKRA
jgi:hypothetical protein